MIVTKALLGWMLIGLVAGLLSRLLRPAGDPGGAAVAILIGIAGALLAGFVALAVGLTDAGDWHGYAAAGAGAVVLLALYRLVLARRL